MTRVLTPGGSIRISRTYPPPSLYRLIRAAARCQELCTPEELDELERKICKPKEKDDDSEFTGLDQGTVGRSLDDQ